MRALDHFQPVAEGVFEKHARHARLRIGNVRDTVGVAVRAKGADVVASESRMALLTRHEVRGHPHMQLTSVGQPKPHTTILFEGGGLAQFRQAQKAAVEGPRSLLASCGGFNLKVIKSGDQSGHRKKSSKPLPLRLLLLQG